MITGTAYFLDGHSEPICNYEITDLGFEHRVEFTTARGRYKLDYEYVPIRYPFRMAEHNWYEWVDGSWIRIPDIFEHVELNQARDAFYTYLKQNTLKELTQSGKIKAKLDEGRADDE